MVKRLLIWSIVVSVFALMSCAKVVDNERFILNKGKSYAVLPFENYTDTPLAGYRVASVFESVLRSRGYRVTERVWLFKEQEPTRKELEKYLKEASERADYVVMGSVNEFRYKVGVDGEPAVSISVWLIESSTGRSVGGATLSASGWSHESLGTVTHELVRTLIK